MLFGPGGPGAGNRPTCPYRGGSRCPLRQGRDREDARRFSPASMHPRWADQLRQLGTEVWWDQAEPHLGQWAVREGATASDGLSDGLRLLSPAEVP